MKPLPLPPAPDGLPAAVAASWKNAVLLEGFVAHVIEHWPADALRVSFSMLLVFSSSIAKRKSFVDGGKDVAPPVLSPTPSTQQRYWFVQLDKFDWRALVADKDRRARFYAAAEQLVEHLASHDRMEVSSAIADVLLRDVSPAVADMNSQRRTQEEWRDWAFANREKPLVDWLESARLEQSLPVSALAPRPRV